MRNGRLFHRGKDLANDEFRNEVNEFVYSLCSFFLTAYVPIIRHGFSEVKMLLEEELEG